MELERQTIVRADFSSTRRGYDQEEVDRHLREIAQAVEDLKRESLAAPRTEAASSTSLAGAAADQVRVIVEAAERSAAEIEANATEEADRVTGEATNQAEQERNTARGEAERVRREAEAAARETRERAEADAARHVDGVREATAAMRERADAVESDLGGLVEQLRSTVETLVGSVRSSAGSLDSELGSIHAGLAQVRDAAPAEEHPEADINAGQATKATATVEPDQPTLPHEVPTDPDTEAEADPEHGEAEAAEDEADTAAEELPLDEGEREDWEDDATEETARAEPEAEAEDEDEDEEPGGGDQAEGARLIALNMALNGTPREETARYLDENFDLDDQDTLLDEVYARVGG